MDGGGEVEEVVGLRVLSGVHKGGLMGFFGIFTNGVSWKSGHEE